MSESVNQGNMVKSTYILDANICVCMTTSACGQREDHNGDKVEAQAVSSILHLHTLDGVHKNLPMHNTFAAPQNPGGLLGTSSMTTPSQECNGEVTGM